MKLLRYNVDNNFEEIQEGSGMYCKSEDVEKLEQLNAKMLEVLKKLKDWEGYTIGQYEDEIQSIIEEAESLK